LQRISFVVQDAVQGHHWDNSQVTLHPFAVYHKEVDEIKCLSFCAMSDCLKHDTTAVHALIGSLLQRLKVILPQLRHIIYFSDGAASQYKNFKNIINLANHEKDFGIKAKWHFLQLATERAPVMELVAL
jgi:hypothetical protein